MQVEQPSEGQRFFQVAWYFAPPGAKLFDKEQSFSSGIWDYEHIAQPPLLGEQPPYAVPWFNGENLWGYTGKCRVGTDDQFANGLSAADLAAPLPAIPACCATPRIGQTWFLRHNLKPPQSLVPGQFVGSNWDNIGAPVSAGLLANTPGHPAEGPLFSVTLPTGSAPQDGFVQYLTPPLAAQTIPSQQWFLAIGRDYTATGGPLISKAFTLSLIDGATGQQKAELLTSRPIGQQPMLTFGSRGESTAPTVPEVVIAFGDYLCLEIGWSVFRFPAASIHYNLVIVDSGSTPVFPANSINTNPLALLQYPFGGGDPDMPLVGSLIPFAGAVTPFGYLACDGTVYNAVDFPALFASIGTTWGAGGPGTFAVPDLRDRVVLGTSPGALSPTRPSAQVLGSVGGEETHTLTVPEMPGHSHTVVDPQHQHGFPTGVNVYTDAPFGPGSTPSLAAPMTVTPLTDFAFTGISLSPTGGDGPHNNLQPFAVVTWLIKW